MPEENVPGWEQFKQQVDLHKFYLEQIVKSASVALGIVGAIVTYVLAKWPGRGPLWMALVPPLVLSAGAAWIFAIGAQKANAFASEVRSLQARLRLPWRPHAELLGCMSVIFAAVFAAVSLGLAVLIVVAVFGLLPVSLTK